MKKVFGVAISLFLLISPWGAMAKAEEPPVVPESNLSVSEMLGPIQSWHTSDGRVSEVDLGELTIASYDWFIELVSFNDPGFRDVILDDEYGIMVFGNIHCASGTAINQAGSDVVWSACLYQTKGELFYSISALSHKKGPLSDLQVEMANELLARSLRALSLPTEPINIK